MVFFEYAMLRFEGSCLPDPGHGGAGYRLEQDEDQFNLIITGQHYIGPDCTYMVAAYFGLINGLNRLRDSNHRIGHLAIESSSSRLMEQIKKKQQPKSRRFQNLHQRVSILIRQCKERRKFDSVSFVRIDRSLNEEAGVLANNAVIEKTTLSKDHWLNCHE